MQMYFLESFAVVLVLTTFIVPGDLKRGRRCAQNKKKCPGLNAYSRYTEVPRPRHIPFGMLGERLPFMESKKCRGQKKQCPKGRFLQYGPIVDPDAIGVGEEGEAFSPGNPDRRFLQGPIGGRNRFDPYGINPDGRFLASKKDGGQRKQYPKGRFLQYNPAVNPGITFGNHESALLLDNPDDFSPENPDDTLRPDRRFVQGPIGGRNRFDPPGINPEGRFLARKKCRGQRKQRPRGRFLQYGPIVDPDGIGIGEHGEAILINDPNENIPGNPDDILTPRPDRRFLQGPIGEGKGCGKQKHARKKN